MCSYWGGFRDTSLTCNDSYRGYVTNFGHEVRMARYARKWTREQLAEETGLTVEQIDAIENGESHPDRVFDALGLVDMQMLTTQQLAAFSVLIHPMLMKIDPDRLGIVLADVLGIIARAAAGTEAESAPEHPTARSRSW